MSLPKNYVVTNGSCTALYVLKKEVVEYSDTTAELHTQSLSREDISYYYEILHEYYDVVYDNKAKEPQKLEEATIVISQVGEDIEFIAKQTAISEEPIRTLSGGDAVE